MFLKSGFRTLWAGDESICDDKAEVKAGSTSCLDDMTSRFGVHIVMSVSALWPIQLPCEPHGTLHGRSKPEARARAAARSEWDLYRDLW